MSEATMCDECGRFNATTTATWRLWRQDSAVEHDFCGDECLIVHVLRTDYTWSLSSEQGKKVASDVILRVADRLGLVFEDRRLSAIKEVVANSTASDKMRLGKIAGIVGYEEEEGQNEQPE